MTQVDDFNDVMDAIPAEDSAIIQQRLDEMYRDEIRQKIEPYPLTAHDTLPPLQPVISRRGELLCSEGNISAVVGEAKSKKTFLCTAIVGSMLDVNKTQQFGIDHNFTHVLWVDTEQSREHIQKILFRINLLGCLPINTPHPRVHTQALREESPEKRMSLMRYAIDYYRPKLVILDGVSDLISNSNNLEESEKCISLLLTLSSAYSCHIMCVLHTNPNSDKARGHLGSTLMRKAESVIFVHRVGETSLVEPQYCRNKPFERFAFRVEEMEDAHIYGEQCIGLGVPVECDMPDESAEAKEDDCVRILRDELGGIAERKLLNAKLVDRLGVTQNYARVKVSRAIERGLLRMVDDNCVTVA